MAYLTREFRYAIGRESIEVAGGGIDEEESPLEAARREAREELGVDASERGFGNLGSLRSLNRLFL
jgi:8-oxo-dGTP pyrophosphatase MutT (NUDIX family)